MGSVARWSISVFDRRGDQGDAGGARAKGHHGKKLVPLEQTVQLVSVGEEMRLTDLEQVIPYAGLGTSCSRTPITPERVLTRPPSAELHPDQKDTDTLPPHNLLDPILEVREAGCRCGRDRCAGT